MDTINYQWTQYVIPLMVTKMYEYLDRNITKSTLAHTMDSLVLQKSLQVGDPEYFEAILSVYINRSDT